jgi:toxin ParE1/3/4
MRFNINVSSYAEIDLYESFVFYEEREAGLGDKFISYIDESFNFIAENYLASPVIYKKVRRFVARRFPFFIYYLINASENEILIIGVLHSKRNPKLFKKRC